MEDSFFDIYKTFQWISECKKYEKATECLDKDLAAEALEMLHHDIVVDPKSLMKRIKYLPYKMSKNDILKEFDNLPNQPIKAKLKEYINLYTPDWFRVYIFWNGYIKLQSDGLFERLKGIEMIDSSRINIEDEIIKKNKLDRYELINYALKIE